MPEGLTALFNDFALPVVMIIVLIAGCVKLFKYMSEQNDKHDSDIKLMTETYNNEVRDISNKYYAAYIEVQKSNDKVISALDNNSQTIQQNTHLIEKLIDKLDEK